MIISRYALTLQCELTKYVEAYPLISKKSDEVARAFVNNFILRYGVPKDEIGNKFEDVYSGPYKVVKDMSPNVEIINEKGTVDVIHKNRTKLYVKNNNEI